ncbi:hypothetical protein [Nocardia brevicatena]|uniref:hypothetical protein n=1 Tax=Nocardia brevicatena TaxID=37327 RepID=UPI00278BF9F7|nr:hypothetical protein [Nocardia brevicatena]
MARPRAPEAGRAVPEREVLEREVFEREAFERAVAERAVPERERAAVVRPRADPARAPVVVVLRDLPAMGSG